MNKRNTSFWQKAKRVILCILMVFMFDQAVTPAPAQAQVTAFVTELASLATKLYKNVKAAARWAMEELHLDKIFDLITDLYEIFAKQFAKLIGYFYASGAAEIMSQQMVAQVKYRADKEIMNARTEHTIAAANARQVERLTPPKDPTLCKSIMVHQLVTTTDDFEREVSRMIVEGVSSRARYQGEDGNGPLQIMKDTVFRCAGDLKLGSVYDGHNGCHDTNTTQTRGTDGRMLQDADLSTVDGSQIYEMPQIREDTRTVDGQTFTVRYPYIPSMGERYDDQKFWMAAFNSLYQLAGARPSPLSGTALQTPTGMAQRAMFNHCIANQNALIKQCADLLAFYTRPNLDDPGSARLREQQNKMCQAAKGVVQTGRFGDCAKGLSPYETLLLQQSFCLSSNHFMGLKAGGYTDAQARVSSDICAESWTNFMTLVARKHYNCTAAVDAINEMGSCWEAVESMGQGASGGMRSSSATQAAPQSKMHKVKAEAANMNNGSKALPKAVGQ